jgi:hypothetical protein
MNGKNVQMQQSGTDDEDFLLPSFGGATGFVAVAPARARSWLSAFALQPKKNVRHPIEMKVRLHLLESIHRVLPFSAHFNTHLHASIDFLCSTLIVNAELENVTILV